MMRHCNDPHGHLLPITTASAKQRHLFAVNSSLGECWQINIITDQVKSGLLLDVVVGEGPAVLKLLASEDQTLLVRGDSLLVLVSRKDK